MGWSEVTGKMKQNIYLISEKANQHISNNVELLLVLMFLFDDEMQFGLCVLMWTRTLGQFGGFTVQVEAIKLSGSQEAVFVPVCWASHWESAVGGKASLWNASQHWLVPERWHLLRHWSGEESREGSVSKERELIHEVIWQEENIDMSHTGGAPAADGWWMLGLGQGWRTGTLTHAHLEVRAFSEWSPQLATECIDRGQV